MHPPPSHGFKNENNPSTELINTNHYLDKNTPTLCREFFTNIKTRYKPKTKNKTTQNNKGGNRNSVNINIGRPEHANAITSSLGI